MDFEKGFLVVVGSFERVTSYAIHIHDIYSVFSANVIAAAFLTWKNLDTFSALSSYGHMQKTEVSFLILLKYFLWLLLLHDIISRGVLLMSCAVFCSFQQLALNLLLIPQKLKVKEITALL